MKTKFYARLPANLLADITIQTIAGCGVASSDQIKRDEDVKNYFDYVPTSKRLVSQTDTQVQHAFGPPTRVRRVDDDTVIWIDDHRFCEADARFIYRVMALRIEGHKLVSMRPEEPR